MTSNYRSQFIEGSASPGTVVGDHPPEGAKPKTAATASDTVQQDRTGAGQQTTSQEINNTGQASVAQEENNPGQASADQAKASNLLEVTFRHARGDGSEMAFRVKPEMAVRKAMTYFADQVVHRRMQQLRFLSPDGERMRPEQTFAEIGIEDKDIVDVYEEQIGGKRFEGYMI